MIAPPLRFDVAPVTKGSDSLVDSGEVGQGRKKVAVACEGRVIRRDWSIAGPPVDGYFVRAKVKLTWSSGLTAAECFGRRRSRGGVVLVYVRRAPPVYGDRPAVVIHSDRTRPSAAVVVDEREAPAVQAWMGRRHFLSQRR